MTANSSIPEKWLRPFTGITRAGQAEIRIGTSGWHYRHWAGPFYPAKTSSAAMFEHYARRLNTVEINNTFYRLPERHTFEAWQEASPPEFLFAVKASRFITHNKKLRDPAPSLERLFEAAGGLGAKLGPILFQLPPKWRLNLERLAEFLVALPAGHRYSFEFREPSWHDRRVFELLRRHNAAYCIYELAGFQTPLAVTADWVYARLHGPAGKYQGSYSERQLKGWAERIVGWSRCLRAIYLYFDNDQSGYAAQNALRLRQLVDEGMGRRAA